MTENVLRRVVGCTRSHEVWKKIDEYFAAHTRAKIHQYMSELRSTKKGSRTIAEYLLRIKALADALIASKVIFQNKSKFEIILEGLPSEYDAFSTALETRMAQEIRTDKDTPKPAATELSVNLANTNSIDKNNNTDKQ